MFVKKNLTALIIKSDKVKFLFEIICFNSIDRLYIIRPGDTFINK